MVIMEDNTDDGVCLDVSVDFELLDFSLFIVKRFRQIIPQFPRICVGKLVG